LLIHPILEGFATVDENNRDFVIELPPKIGVGVDVDLAPSEAAAAGELRKALLDDLAKVASLPGINQNSAEFRHGERF
jgi:hypothetical protein